MGQLRRSGLIRTPPVSDLVFVVAGALDQKTGGYLYDARIVEGLRSLGRAVRVVEVPGGWPCPSPGDLDALIQGLAGCPEGATVVVDGLVGGAAPGPIEAARDRLRLVALVHHPLCDEAGRSESESRRLEALETRTLAAAHGVVVTSGFTAERLTRMGVARERVRVVEPGTDARNADARNDDVRAPRGASAPVHLLCVGSVVPRKNQLGLLRALERVHEAAPDLAWRCDIVGSLSRDADYAAALLEHVARSPVSERVTCTGEVDDSTLEEFWCRGEVLVSASTYEGFGMALTEGMVRGLAVIAVEGGAVATTVRADVGLLVPAGPPDRLADALADALTRVVSDADLRADRARRARRHAATLPTWDEQTLRFEAALRELVDV